MESPLFKNAAVIGVGLIGGSLGMALKKRGLARSVVGIGRSPERLQRAQDLRAVDSWTTDLETGVREADLIYVSTPVGTEADFIRRAAAAAKPGAVITDAGSTKSGICADADAAMPQGVFFVGGHPMAGSEATGVEAARAELFVGAAYVLTPTANTSPEALSGVHSLAEAVGSRVVIMDPVLHDECVAVISHLPHLIAAALVSLAKERSESAPEVLEVLAGSFRDMTRVAGSSPVLWRDICMSNSTAIGDAVEEFATILERAAKLIQTGDNAGFEKWFTEAKEAREALYTREVDGE